MRDSVVTRTTKETDINLKLNLDGNGIGNISTGVGFFDHMLNSFAKHSGFDLELNVKGDLHVDCHHTVEDAGICLGSAFDKALKDKSGICRFGSFFVPMDESLAFCSVDISNRPCLVFNGEFKDQKIGEYDTQMTEEFFRAFTFSALITLHINILYGKNDHHKTEAAFKALAHALSIAVQKREGGVLSTKGSI